MGGGGGVIPRKIMQAHFDKTSNIITQNQRLTAQIQLPHSVEPTTMVSEFLNHNCKGELF